MAVASAQFRDAAQQLRSAAGSAEAAAARHDAYGRALGGALAELSHAWGSPEAERIIREGLSFASAAAEVPAGMSAAESTLRALAGTAQSLAEEVAHHERQLAAAEATAAEVARARWTLLPDDLARMRALEERATAAATAAARAREAIDAAARRWEAACRTTAADVRFATMQIGSLAGGPVPPGTPGPAGAGGAGGGIGMGDVATWGWGYLASPALTVFKERGSTEILHLVARDLPPAPLRVNELPVSRRGHWRRPPALRSPNSPLHGTTRLPHWVSPVYGTARTVERGTVPGQARPMRDIAARVDLPKESWSRTTRVLGRVNNVGTVGFIAYEEVTDVAGRDDLGTGQKVGNVVTTVGIEGGMTVGGGVAGAKGGALGGAAIGTLVLPGVGTAVGGAVGAVAGGIAGSKLGQSVGGSISDGFKRLWGG